MTPIPASRRAAKTRPRSPRDLDGVEVQRRLMRRIAIGQAQGQGGEAPVIARGQALAARDIVVEPLQLALAQGGLDVGHAIVEAQLDLLVIPGALGCLPHPRPGRG